MANALDASMVILTEKDVTPRGSCSRRRVVEVLVRKVPESQQFIELRLAVLGGADVGKSTFCGVMTQGCLDDGNGKTRLNLFRFPHEVRSGKTSSVCLDVIGFDSRGKLVNYAQNSLEELVERSKKIVTLIDLAGDSKYLKTTIHGLTGYKPHFACLLVSAEIGPTSTTKEHLGLAAALNIPVFVIITKWDLVEKEQLDRVIKSVTSFVSRAGMVACPKRVKRKRDAVKYVYFRPASQRWVNAVPVGPLINGKFFEKAFIGSIRRSRQPVQAVLPGEAVSIALSRLYIGSVRQTAAIVDIDRPSLEQGKWATVLFQLMGGPEYILAGTPLIFRQGKTKGMGEVMEVIED
ncbi:elongation factor Tu GTP binding domain protein [Ostertagia ostertagi]